MNKEKIVEKIKHFWDDTEAISPIVATIMVLVVAVAAGAGLYFWFDEFQEGAQEEVGDSATASMNTISMQSAIILLNPLDSNPVVTGADATDDTPDDNAAGDASIYYALDHTIGGYTGPNGKNGVGWTDERFVVEIPIIITSKTDLGDLTLTALEPNVLTGTLRSGRWLHLDRNDEYRLLKNDGSAFVGYINDSTTEVPEVVGGYKYYFGGDSHLGIYPNQTATENATGTVAKGTKTLPYVGEIDVSDIYYPLISRVSGSLSVMRLYTDDGATKYAFAKNNTNDEFGWITSHYNASSTDMYFSGDKLKPIFQSGVYEVADELPANEAVTGYAYFMVSVLSLDNGVAEIELPFRLTTKEGLTETITVTLVVED